MAKGPIPPLPPLNAKPDELVTARDNIAERCRERGEMALASSFVEGRQDAGWAIRHEVYRIRTMAGAA